MTVQQLLSNLQIRLWYPDNSLELKLRQCWGAIAKRVGDRHLGLRRTGRAEQKNEEQECGAEHERESFRTGSKIPNSLIGNG